MSKRLATLAERYDADQELLRARDIQWLGEINDALGDDLPPARNPSDAGARLRDVLAELRESDAENDSLRSRLDKAERDLGSLEKIENACPSCGGKALVIGPGGRLMCSLAACIGRSVGRAWRERGEAGLELLKAAEDAAQFNGEERRARLAAAAAAYRATL